MDHQVDRVGQQVGNYRLEQLLGSGGFADLADVSDSLRDLARVYSAQERYDQAEALLLRSLAILEHTYEPTHPRIANNLYLLARVYDDQGAFEQATSYYQRALAIQQSALGEEHPETRATLERFAALQRKVQGGGKKAE